MKTFQQQRKDYSPYGLTCELWHPTIMGRFDHHNEIEINFIPEGSMRYFFHDRIVTIPEQSVCVFWGFLSHRIIDFRGISSYYVITIPTPIFLKWNLSKAFISRLFTGDMIIDSSNVLPTNTAQFDRWLNDAEHPKLAECMGLELQSLMKRIDIASPEMSCIQGATAEFPMSKTQEMVLYISHNYHKSIRTSDIAGAVGLNPDYAGSLFRKTLGQTMTQYLAKERIASAQRAMLFTGDSITQIAYDSGFNSVSSFNIAFKQISGQTPREYRKLIRYTESQE